MARVPLIRLVALQEHRSEEIAAISERMRTRAPDSFNATIIQARIHTVNELWAEIRSTHHDIMLRADASRHTYITENKYDAMHRTFEDTHDWLLTSLSNFNRGEERNPRNLRPRDVDEDEQSDYGHDRPAKLPRLDLPSFSGKYEDWDSFADIFTTLVHNTSRIADTTKLQYLKSCLKGSAAELVKDVAILGINYASTWQALRERFHNPRLTMNKLLDSLNSLPYLKKESAVELRSFVDETQRIVRALANLKAPVSHWDLWLVHMLEVRIDPESRKIWESELIARERQRLSLSADGENSDTPRLPKFVDLMALLEKRAQSLSVIHADREDKRVTQSGGLNHGSRRVHHTQASSSAKASKCVLCQGDHYIIRCPTFLAKGIHDRQSDVRNLKLCFNCLGSHKFRNCKSNFCCKVCGEKHHSLLHHNKRSNVQAGSGPTGNSQNSNNAASAPVVRANVARLPITSRVSIKSCSSAATTNYHVLLATAQVIIIGPYGKQTRARALLDQGSEATFVSESLTQLLGLQRDRVDTTLTGIGGCTAGSVKFATRFTMQSMHEPESKFEVNAFILQRLTSEIPSRDISELNLEQFKHLSLADPDFHISDRFDLLIGADLYGLLLRSGLERFSKNLLVAQNTALGWIISGQTRKSMPRRAALTNIVSVKTLQCTVNNDLSELLQRFWTIEEVPALDGKMKPSDEACEKLFLETHSRGADGRYVVRLPLVDEPPRVATETRRMALGSLNHQHRRFSRDPKLKDAYIDFMETYIKLGHMERIPAAELNNPRSWYLPHHLIVQNTGERLKPRVVFDASRRTHDQRCLNDYFAAGPALQSDLSLVLLNWRRFGYAFTADIVKMFRQI